MSRQQGDLLTLAGISARCRLHERIIRERPEPVSLARTLQQMPIRMVNYSTST